MWDRFKCRSWHKPTKTMEYNGLWTGRNWDRKLADNNIVLMQRTSLKDKNGKLIHSGDFLKNPLNNYIYEVGCGDFTISYTEPFQIKILGFYIKYRDDNGETIYDSLAMMALDNCEIIGNVYENPELLEAKGEE